MVCGWSRRGIISPSQLISATHDDTVLFAESFFNLIGMSTEDLRDSTYPEHQASEKKMLIALKGVKTKEDYVRLLNWLYGFYAPVEKRIRAYLTKDFFPDMDRRSRSESLLTDILESGLPVPVPEYCTELPLINSFASALGALYVLEGNTLGGRIIAGMISSLLGSAENITFFNGYGAETGTMWKNLKEFLNRSLSDDQWRIITDTATKTFISFKNWIDKHEFQPHECAG